MKSNPHLIGKSFRLTETDILREALRLVQHNIDTQGQALWALLFQQKSAQGTAQHQLIASSWRELNQQSLLWLKSGLQKTNGAPMKWALLTAIRASTYLSSTAMGVLLPQANLVLHRKDQKQDAITLKNASLFFVELVLEWFGGIIDRTLLDAKAIENQELNKRVCSRLEEARLLFRDSQNGIAKGSVLRRYGNTLWHRVLKRQPKDLQVPLDSRAFQAMEQFFSVLLNHSK